MSSIPDEAVDAAASILDQPDDPFAITDIARDMLEAALPHLTASVDREYSTVLLQAELKMSQQAERIRELEDGIRQHRGVHAELADRPEGWEEATLEADIALWGLLDGATP